MKMRAAVFRAPHEPLTIETVDVDHGFTHPGSV